MVARKVQVLKAGLLGYQKGLQLQKLVGEKVREKTWKDTLIVVEHYPVYTVGIREKMYSSEEEGKLKGLGAEFHRTNRGGLITFHGPGQMVVYPILDLRNFNPSVRWYVARLEQTVIEACARFGIQAYTSPHTGVWVRDMKICALGIHASRYVTSHGLALNCNTDLTWFKHIVPCGIPNKTVTSLTQEAGRQVGVAEGLEAFLKAFQGVFECGVEEGGRDMEEVVSLLS